MRSIQRPEAVHVQALEEGVLLPPHHSRQEVAPPLALTAPLKLVVNFPV